MSHSIDRYDHCADSITINLGNGREIRAELDRDGEIELSFDYEEAGNFGGTRAATAERWLEKADAIALARFILDQYGETA